MSTSTQLSSMSTEICTRVQVSSTTTLMIRSSWSEIYYTHSDTINKCLIYVLWLCVWYIFQSNWNQSSVLIYNFYFAYSLYSLNASIQPHSSFCCLYILCIHRMYQHLRCSYVLNLLVSNCFQHVLSVLFQRLVSLNSAMCHCTISKQTNYLVM